MKVSESDLQKGKPLKKTEDTDAIFANVAAVKAEIAAEAKVRAKARGEPETLEISVDTKAKVALGDYSRGGKNQDEFGGGNAEGVGS